MNQILVTKKLYITPELKRKKKMYKFDFLISIFLVCILTSLYIYAEYDRNKSEETSQQILEDMNQLLSQDAQTDTTIAKDNILLVVLDDAEDNGEDVVETETTNNTTTVSTAPSVQAEKKDKTEDYRMENNCMANPCEGCTEEACAKAPETSRMGTESRR